uniref:Uncharacterized protein n=1 Tax=Anguilla anguilla TaxID=7936 RepID=A0A0E9W7T6_ANGAN
MIQDQVHVFFFIHISVINFIPEETVAYICKLIINSDDLTHVTL